MADVPAWLLVFQTLAAGGVGLAGSFIVPQSQREAKAAEAKAASYAVMRDKAEQIFTKIGELRTQNTAIMLRLVAGFSGVHEGDFGKPDAEATELLTPLSGLVATYYPDGVKMLTDARESREKTLMPLIEVMGNIADGVHSFEGQKQRLRIASAATKINMHALAALQTFMLDAVRPYAPKH